MMRRLSLLILIAPMLASCGLHPVYAGGAHGPVATSLAQISVAPIPERAGWLTRNALIDRLGTKLNLGCEAARGKICMKMDDDDWYAPRYLETPGLAGFVTSPGRARAPSRRSSAAAACATRATASASSWRRRGAATRPA